MNQGKLKTRIYAVRRSAIGSVGVKLAFAPRSVRPMLRVGGLKGYSDGSLGSTTAWFFEPYLDDPKTVGLAVDIPPMYERVKNADAAGLQVMIHAIGDRANDEVLKTFERVSKENGARDRRFPHRTRTAFAPRRHQAFRRGKSRRFDAAVSRE
jgi:predicted amidohydrolase YtcJ